MYNKAYVHGDCALKANSACVSQSCSSLVYCMGSKKHGLRSIQTQTNRNQMRLSVLCVGMWFLLLLQAVCMQPHSTRKAFMNKVAESEEGDNVSEMCVA